MTREEALRLPAGVYIEVREAVRDSYAIAAGGSTREQRTVSRATMVLAVLRRHPLPRGNEYAWYRSMAYSAIERLVITTINRAEKGLEEDGEEVQMLLPGTKNLPTHLSIGKDSDEIQYIPDILKSKAGRELLRARCSLWRKQSKRLMSKADELDQLVDDYERSAAVAVS